MGITPLGALLGLFLALGIFLIIFLIIRSIMLWYWKIDVIVKNQQDQINLLIAQNELIMQQTKVISEFKTQSGVKQVYSAKPQ